MSTFKISPANPMKFVDITSIDDSFNGDFAIKQVLSYQNPKCYFQKWELSDVLRLQILSDFVPTDLVFKDINTDLPSGTSSWAEVESLVTGQTFKIYELEYDFVTLSTGKYYAEFSYIGDGSVIHTLISEPIFIQAVHENTMLLSYTNSENNFDIIFETAIVLNFRVESAIKDYKPKNDRSVYTDQKQNPTQLSAVPYRLLKFYVGFKYGVPEWVFDKINWIQSVDQVQYNGIYYQVISGADYETETNEDNSFLGGSIDIQPVNNNFSKYNTEPTDPTNSFTPMQKVIPYYNVSADFTVGGFFNAFSILEKLCIKKRSPGVIAIKVGTTSGGSQIGEFEVDDNNFTQTIEWIFNSTTTVYITGLSGADCDIFIIYKQLDEPPIDLGSGSGTTPPLLGIGAVIMYEELNPGDLDLDFNTVTGIGRANTNWFGWVICDGRNGSLNWKGRTPVAQDLNDPELSVLGTLGGEKKHLLTVPELPKFKPTFSMAIFLERFNRSGTNQRYYTNAGVNQGTLDINEIGGDIPHNNMQPYLVTLFVKKIS